MSYKINLNDVSTVDNGLRVAPSMRWQDGFEPVLCKSVNIASGSADTDIDVNMKWNLIYVDFLKNGAGGAGTSIAIVRERASVTSSCGQVNLSGTIDGQHLTWGSVTASACSFYPGDILRISAVQDTGSSAAVVNLWGKLVA